MAITAKPVVSFRRKNCSSIRIRSTLLKIIDALISIKSIFSFISIQYILIDLVVGFKRVPLLYKLTHKHKSWNTSRIHHGVVRFRIRIKTFVITVNCADQPLCRNVFEVKLLDDLTGTRDTVPPYPAPQFDFPGKILGCNQQFFEQCNETNSPIFDFVKCNKIISLVFLVKNGVQLSFGIVTLIQLF